MPTAPVYRPVRASASMGLADVALTLVNSAVFCSGETYTKRWRPEGRPSE